MNIQVSASKTAVLYKIDINGETITVNQTPLM